MRTENGIIPDFWNNVDFVEVGGGFIILFLDL
jgi:hypothetical protein